MENGLRNEERVRCEGRGKIRAAERIFLVAAAALTVLSAFAKVELTEPKDGSVVPLLTDAQKAYLSLPRAVRREKFADSAFRKSEMGLPAEKVEGEKKPRASYWPKTVRLAWTAKDGVVCRVSVKDAKTGVCVYEGASKDGTVNIDNLEIAATYEWSVDDGEDPATARFRTEDTAPRLVRFPGVPNVRDLGGRIGRGGRRVRQGMVFRSAGLNENAGLAYYTLEELEREGKLAELEAKIAAAEERLRKLEAWQKVPATFDREDAEYKDWCTRHPHDPLARFLSSRIARAKRQIKNKDFKIPRGRTAGKSRVEGENGAYILSRFGIRSDIDLRSDGECFGMAGSPLGDTVTWFHYSSSAYGGMQKAGGKEAFAKVFGVFLDRKNYPIDFHCIAGQDRTGAVAFILNALLGVEEEQLYFDWEVTGFWNRSTWFRHETLFDGLVDGFRKAYPAPTINESVEKYVLSIGFTAEDIDKFRGIMLD